MADALRLAVDTEHVRLVLTTGDNIYTGKTLAGIPMGASAAGRASFRPGLFYRVRYGANIEFICIDTSKEGFFSGRLFELPRHQEFSRPRLLRRQAGLRGGSRSRVIRRSAPDRGTTTRDRWRC